MDPNNDYPVDPVDPVDDYVITNNILDLLETESNIDDIKHYLDSLNTDEASLSAIEASLDLLEWALTPRVISGVTCVSSNLHGHGWFQDPEDINWQLPQVNNFLGILTEMHLLGDSILKTNKWLHHFLMHSTIHLT